MQATTQTTATSIINASNISNRAMKVHLHRGGTAKRVRDKDAEQLVKSTLGDEGQIVSRELFKSKTTPLAKYQQIGNEMYAYHVKATLPFGDDGGRLIPTTAYLDYTTKMQAYLQQQKDLAIDIIGNWQQLVLADVRDRNNSLYTQGKPQNASESDYPTASQIASKLYVKWYPEPVSTSNDFRFEVPDDLKRALDAQLDEYVAAAGKEVYVRMLDPVSAFVEKCGKYTGEKGQRWHDSFVDNLSALQTELAPLNINDDPQVSEFLKKIDDIIRPYALTPAAIKDDPVARSAMRAKFAELESSLKGYVL